MLITGSLHPLVCLIHVASDFMKPIKTYSDVTELIKLEKISIYKLCKVSGINPSSFTKGIYNNSELRDGTRVLIESAIKKIRKERRKMKGCL